MSSIDQEMKEIRRGNSNVGAVSIFDRIKSSRCEYRSSKQ